MDSLLFIIGLTIILIAIVLIIRNRRKSILSELEEYDEEIDFEQNMDFTTEEDKIIKDFSRELDEINYQKQEIYRDQKNKNTVDKYIEPIESKASSNLADESLEEKDSKELISLLYKEGLDENEIAKKLDIGKREVEIVLKVKGLKKQS